MSPPLESSEEASLLREVLGAVLSSFDSGVAGVGTTLDSRDGNGRVSLPTLSLANVDAVLDVCITSVGGGTGTSENPARDSPTEFLIACWTRALQQSGKVDEGSLVRLKRALFECLLRLWHAQLDQGDASGLETCVLLAPSAQSAESSRFVNPTVLLDDLATSLDQEGDQLGAFLDRQFTSWNVRLRLLAKSTDAVLALADAVAICANIATLTASKKITALLPDLPAWLPPEDADSAARLDFHALLGPVLRLGPGPDVSPQRIADRFPTLDSLNPPDVVAFQSARRLDFRPTQNLLFKIFDQLVRSPAAEAVRSYIARIATLNQRRTATVHDATTLSSSVTLFNLHVLLLRLAKPVADKMPEHIGKLLPDYYETYSAIRLDIDKETRLGSATGVAQPTPTAPTAPDLPSFVNDVFFLAAQFMHIGLVPTIRANAHARDQIEQLQIEYARVDSGTHWRGTREQADVESALTSLQMKILDWQRYQIGLEMQLFDTKYLSLCVPFCSLSLSWLLRLADPTSKYPQPRLCLPLPEPLSPSFARLPAFLLGDTLRVLSFTLTYETNHAPEEIDDRLTLVVLTSVVAIVPGRRLANPHLRHALLALAADLVEARSSRESRRCLFEEDAFIRENLVASLIAIYVDPPPLSSSLHLVTRLFAAVLATKEGESISDMYCAALQSCARKARTTYERFIKEVLEEAADQLDEGISDLFRLARRPSQPTNDPEADRYDQERAHAEAQATVRRGEQAIWLLAYVALKTSQSVLEPAVAPSFVKSLTALLRFAFGRGAQPSAATVFDRNAVVISLLRVYHFLGLRPSFATIVASLRESTADAFHLFAKVNDAAPALRSRLGAPAFTPAQLLELRTTLQALLERRHAQYPEDTLTHFPNRFEDPLTSELMLDPVRLPSSGQVVDRFSITAHLRTSLSDPFTREPLAERDLLEEDKLRAEIHSWLEERRATAAPAPRLA